MKDITGTTKTCALIGNPTEHSLSPTIHNSISFMTQNDMAYTTFCVEKDDLGDAVKGAYALGIQGMNVTVPHKENVMEHLVEIDPIAEAVGAVNTLIRVDGGFKGANTDLLGFARSLKEAGFDVKGKPACILGAGGVARAICFALVEAGIESIYILNRTKEKSLSIRNALNSYYGYKKVECHVFDYDYAEKLNIEDFLLVQTTNVGMYPHNADCILADDSSLFEKATYGFDVIYNPYETTFMKRLAKHGKKSIDGLDMLLYQAIESYKMWFPDIEITPHMESCTKRKLMDSFGISKEPTDDLFTSCVGAPKPKDNIILTGYMGSGKTTLGHWISKRTGKVFIDTDKEIEKEYGKTISEIFESEGEEGFRNIETNFLKKMLSAGISNCVISVGGGTPLRRENRSILKKIGTVVYLRAGADELYGRLRYDARRPLLFGKEGEERREFIKKSLSDREASYLEGAHIVIRTDGVYFPKIYQVIHRKIKNFNSKGYKRRNRRVSFHKNKVRKYEDSSN